MLGGASNYTSCPDCGTSVALEILHADRHRCDGRHRDDHVVRLVLAEADLFELELREYLDSPRGRFEVFYAAHSRRG